MANKKNKKENKPATTPVVAGLTSEQKEAEAQRIADEKAEAVKPVNATVKAQQEAKKKRDKARKAFEAQKIKEQQAQEEAGKGTNKSVKENRPTFTDDYGRKFRFKQTAPETLNIDGVSRKIADIIKDEDLMLELTSGNNNFLEQLY